MQEMKRVNKSIMGRNENLAIYLNRSVGKYLYPEFIEYLQLSLSREWRNQTGVMNFIWCLP